MSVATVPQAALAPVIPIESAVGGRQNEALLAQYARARSPQTLDRLVRDNQALVHHILKRFRYGEESYEDLLQVANLGLIKAAQNYDARRGVKFSTYATVVIEGEVRHHLRDSLLLRQPRWLRRVYGQIQGASAELAQELGRPPRIAEIAQRLNINEDGVHEVLAAYARLDLQALGDGDEGDGPGMDRRCLYSQRHESFVLPIEDRLALDEALERLSEFQRQLVDLLFFREFTQREVADLLGVTHKKVSRELGKALTRLREVMGKRIF